MTRTRKMTLAKRDRAYDAIKDALWDAELMRRVPASMRDDLARAVTALEDLTGYLR